MSSPRVAWLAARPTRSCRCCTGTSTPNSLCIMEHRLPQADWPRNHAPEQPSPPHGRSREIQLLSRIGKPDIQVLAFPRHVSNHFAVCVGERTCRYAYGYVILDTSLTVTRLRFSGTDQRCPAGSLYYLTYTSAFRRQRLIPHHAAYARYATYRMYQGNSRL